MKSLPLFACASLFAAALAPAWVSAATITFDEATLSSGLSVAVDGVTLTASATAGGSIGTFTTPPFLGIYVGRSDASTGRYELAFSTAISSIEIEFDALSATGSPPPETLTGFATDLGPAAIVFTPQEGTSFDGTTIFTTIGDGQGIVNFAGPAFTSFLFTHAQNPSQNGFVIERITIVTAGNQAVPVPAALPLLATALAGLVGARRSRRAA